MPVWIVTGGSGFIGRHLLERLANEAPVGVPIVAIGRRQPRDWPAELFRQVDLADSERLVQVIGELGPSLVFHVAGQTPPAARDDFYQRNTLTTIRLLETLRESGQSCRVVLVGSAAELGPVPVEDLPVAEDYPCRPVDPYSRSKWLATMAGLATWTPLEVVIARVFNPIGPGLPASQALGRFAEALANGQGPMTLVVGDLTPRRDFIDVRDLARALFLLATQGLPGQLYHVGTGQSHAVGDGLDHLIRLSGRDVKVEVDLSRVPGKGPIDSRADIRKITDQVGWLAEIAWEQSLTDLWEHALRRSRAGLTDQ